MSLLFNLMNIFSRVKGLKTLFQLTNNHKIWFGYKPLKQGIKVLQPTYMTIIDNSIL